MFNCFIGIAGSELQILRQITKKFGRISGERGRGIFSLVWLFSRT